MSGPAKPPACSVCGKPAITAKVEKDGTTTPFCADHIPSEEARAFAQDLRDHGWNAPEPKH